MAKIVFLAGLLLLSGPARAGATSAEYPPALQSMIETAKVTVLKSFATQAAQNLIAAGLGGTA